MSKIFLVVTCMGRLHHIKQTISKAFIDGFGYVLSDYGCPDKTGDWVEANYPRAIVVRTPAKAIGVKKIFKKVEANNNGAKAAIEAGAEYLCFVDADSLLRPGFHDWVKSHVSREKFLTISTEAYKLQKSRQLSGFICIHKDHFEAVGGYDSSMEGWGGDDLDMRLKMYVLRKIRWEYIPPHLMDPIVHSDHFRMRFHELSTKESTNALNLNKVMESFKTWTGKYPNNFNGSEFSRDIYELLGLPRDWEEKKDYYIEKSKHNSGY